MARREGSPGPSRDLNLMTERARCEGQIRVQRAGVIEAQSDTAIIVVVDGHAVFGEEDLGPLDSVVCGPATAIAITGEATLAICAICAITPVASRQNSRPGDE